MIVTLFIGLFATIIGALPPGASNLAVVQTTAEENIQESLKISYGAAIGEMIIAFLALCFGMTAQLFYEENEWVQLSFSILMAALGFFFLIKKYQSPKDKKSMKTKFARGFFFGLINPPVLIYWIALFSLLSSYYSISDRSPWFVLGLFFGGVFMGKVVVLYGYAKLSYFIIKRNGHLKEKLNKAIGFVLMGLAVLQSARLLFF